MHIDLFTSTELSESLVHGRLVERVPYAKCSQGENLVSFAELDALSRIVQLGKMTAELLVRLK